MKEKDFSGIFLADFRKHLRLHQKELAEKLNIAQTTIARYETDRVHPTAGVIKKYVEVFNANPLFLLTGEGRFTLSEEKAKCKQTSGDSAICNLPLSKKIQILRTVLGLTQGEFAEAIETTQASISRYEKDDRIPDAIFLSNVVEKFDVNPDWLLTTSTILMFRNTKKRKGKI